MARKYASQISLEDCMMLYESGDWESWTPNEIVNFQLFQKKLCVPWGKFHESVEEVLGRGVFTHEFAGENGDKLRDEYLRLRDRPTMDEILGQLPEDKTFVVRL